MAKVFGDNLGPITKRAKVSMIDALAASLYGEGLALLSESLREVPVATGRLRNTGYVNPPRTGGRGLVVEVGYGTDYAVPVHEKTEVNHPVGKAKFLADPLNTRLNGFERRVGARAKRFFDRRIGVESVIARAPKSPPQGSQ